MVARRAWSLITNLAQSCCLAFTIRDSRSSFPLCRISVDHRTSPRCNYFFCRTTRRNAGPAPHWILACNRCTWLLLARDIQNCNLRRGLKRCYLAFVASNRHLTQSRSIGGATEQIVGREPREACFASSVIRLSCPVAPWPGQHNRWADSTKTNGLIGEPLLIRKEKDFAFKEIGFPVGCLQPYVTD